MQVGRRARNELKEMDKQVFKILSEFLEDDLEYCFFQTKTFSLDWNYFSFTQMKKYALTGFSKFDTICC